MNDVYPLSLIPTRIFTPGFKCTVVSSLNEKKLRSLISFIMSQLSLSIEFAKILLFPHSACILTLINAIAVGQTYDLPIVNPDFFH